MNKREQAESLLDTGIEMTAAGFDKGVDTGLELAARILDNMDHVVRLMQLPIERRREALAVAGLAAKAKFRRNLANERPEILAEALKKGGLL